MAPVRSLFLRACPIPPLPTGALPMHIVAVSERSSAHRALTRALAVLALVAALLPLANANAATGRIAASTTAAAGSGLVAAYSFDEGTGSTIGDASGAGN